MRKNHFRQITSIFFILCISIFLGCIRDKSSITGSIPSYFRDYIFVEPEVTGNTFYIDPVNGSADGDGSATNPWRTLQEVIEGELVECYRHSETNNPDSELEIVHAGAPVKGGDRLLLRNGYHGYIGLNNFILREWLTIAAESGHTPVLAQFRIEGAFEKIYLKNLTVLKENFQGDEDYWQVETLNRNNGSCVYLCSSSFWGEGSRVKLNGLKVKTAENTSSWSAADWVEKSASGISLRSVKNVEVVNCVIENIRHGICIEYFSDNSIAMNNTINNYSADGCRLISNNVLFAYNTITNCYKVDDNHDDAIQSYTRGEDFSAGTGVLSNVVVRGNLIIGTPDADNPLAGNPQGIGCFDGFFDSWIVENNVVITDHYHGISFYGMRNSMIVNNTVIDQIPGNNTCPWILINPHKDGRESENCTIANNIVSSSVGVNGINVRDSNNYVFGRNNYQEIYHFFCDPDNFDFHLLVNDSTKSSIIDKGSIFPELVSTEIDRDRKRRNAPPDIGAYEAQ
jgi:hypothetical protein